MSDFKIVTPGTPKAIRNALSYVKSQGVVGNYYEFGVYTGYSFWQAYKAAQELELDDMSFIGFDSFEGLPTLKGIDQGWKFEQGDYDCSFAQVWTNLDREGIDWSKAALLKMWFDQLPMYRLPYKPVAVALIDCDLYHSTVPVLAFLYMFLLQDHCILIFDDWNCFDADPNRGQRKAFGEFLQARPDWIAEPFESFEWHGQSFIMRQKG